MTACNIRQIWDFSYEDYCMSGHQQSDVQKKASRAILSCKTGKLGVNMSSCPDCGYTEVHNNSCRNRNCPNCQAVKKELWVDSRRSEVIDSSYFHVVFTLPHELNSLIYCNQKTLYALFHKCCSKTLLELSANPKYLGAVPGIIQVLHTWDQELNYHVHMHCIISGGGLTKDQKIRKSKGNFFIPVYVLRDKFKGKFLASLNDAYNAGYLNKVDNDIFIEYIYLFTTDNNWLGKNHLYGKQYVDEDEKGYFWNFELLNKILPQTELAK